MVHSSRVKQYWKEKQLDPSTVEALLKMALKELELLNEQLLKKGQATEQDLLEEHKSVTEQYLIQSL
jgi:hypothetical protein